MTHYLKNSVSICLLAVLSLHFIFIIIYSSPIPKNNIKIVAYSQKYVYPFFHQSWCLFVPAPINSNQVFVKIKDTKKWLVVFPTKLIPKYKHSTLGNDAISLLFSNSIIYELETLPNTSTVFTTIQKNKEFEILNYAIYNYLNLNNALVNTKDYEILLISNNKNENLNYLFKTCVSE